MSGTNTTRRTLSGPARGPEWCIQKFLHYFPKGFRDETYVDWERSYKWQAHEQWRAELGESKLQEMIHSKRYEEIAARAVRIESRTNLLFSFEKMALRDAVRSRAGARTFAKGLHAWLHGAGDTQNRFDEWCRAIAALPRRQTRVLTWPLVTVFGFIAQPDQHMFLKPNVTRIAAGAFDFSFDYASTPAWPTYGNLLDFATVVLRATRQLKPRDMIDAQGFIWVAGSDEYPNRRRWVA